jgi:hypothetical protein
MKRKPPLSLTTNERRSKPRIRALIEKSVYNVYNFNHKLFAVLGFIRQLPAIYNEHKTWYSLKQITNNS